MNEGEKDKSNCRCVVSDSNMAVTVGMSSPSMVAIGMVSIPGVGFGICFSFRKSKWGHGGKEENKLKFNNQFQDRDRHLGI